jgi:hypothetical protein
MQGKSFLGEVLGFIDALPAVIQPGKSGNDTPKSVLASL